MDKNISVTHITNQLGLGGTQKAMEILVRNLDSERYDISVCGYEEGGERGEILREDGYRVDVLNSPSELETLLKERSTDVLHMHGMYDTGPEVTAVARDIDLPVVVKTTPFGRVNDREKGNLDLLFYPSKMTLLRELKLKNIRFNQDKSADEYWFQYYPLSESDMSDRIESNFRNELDIDQGTPVIGKIGRSSAAKWSKLSIDAFERIIADAPEARLLLVTPPEKIKEEISERGFEESVDYLNKIPPSEVGKFYNTIDVLTHASAIGESFGYVIAEAMAYETPVVVDSNPMRDNAQIELVNNGETGFVVGSPKAYADATLELLRSDEQRREFGTAARERATTLFDPKPIVDELETIYRVLYESNGDSAALEDELKPQREMMAEFAGEYRHRLHDLYGSESMKHQLERSTWRLCSEFLPVGRSKVYHGLQGPFKDI